MDVAAVERHAVQEALGEGIDAARILADRQVLQLVNAGLGGLDEAVQRAFSNAVESGIGYDPHEQPVLPAGADGIGFYVDDLHDQPSFSNLAMIASVDSPYVDCSVGTDPQGMNRSGRPIRVSWRADPASKSASATRLASPPDTT